VEKCNVGKLIRWKKVIKSCLKEIDEEVISGNGGCGTKMNKGSTTLLLLVGKKGKAVANCGDFRILLGCDSVVDTMQGFGILQVMHAYICGLALPPSFEN